jgi:hypothetical protein
MKTGWLLTLVVAAAAGAGAYYYWHQQGPGPLDIQTAEVKRGDVRRVVSTSGTVSALVTVDIGSQLSGNIGAVNVDYSSEVKQGEVLARIEPSSFETRVREEEGQRLSGMNNDQSRAFYGAEAGMEKLTADLGALFGVTYAPTGSQVDALATFPPALPSSAPVKFIDSLGNSSYKIDYTKDSNGNPKAAFAQITSGSSPYQGMTALETPYTLTVGARTTNGAEVKLQRTLQTVGIPLFQFGIYCEGDCSFFPGPNFNFGGRVHTNGNLFLNSGGPAGAGPTNTGSDQVWLANPVTVVKDIFRDCLSNTHPESATGTHPGSVEITKGGGSFQALGFGQGSRTSCLGSAVNPAWPSISASFNGNLRSGVKPLNLTITLLGNGTTQPIDMIRRPIRGEDASNPGVLGERYFAQASLKILLSDNAADITNLPCVSAGAPLNLADLARPVALWATVNAINLKAAMVAAGTIPLPLAASGATTAAYVQGYTPPLPAAGPVVSPATGTIGADGYWQPNGKPIITGYIKIDAQTAYGNPCGIWKDVTQEILSLGYAGKNINPVSQSLDGNNLNPMWSGTNATMQLGKAPALPILPIGLNIASQQLSPQNGTTMAAGNFAGPSTSPATAGYSVGSCLDPNPNAIIRLERIRDNPSSVNVQAGTRSASAPIKLPVLSTVAEVCVPVGVRIFVVGSPTVVPICLAGAKAFVITEIHRLPQCLRTVFVCFIIGAAAFVSIDRRRIEIRVIVVIEPIVPQLGLLLAYAV